MIVTLCATPYRNSNPCSPLFHVHFQDTYFVSITSLFSILTLTLDPILRTPYARSSLTLPIPCLSLIYPDRGFRNPVLGLLIPLLHS